MTQKDNTGRAKIADPQHSHAPLGSRMKTPPLPDSYFSQAICKSKEITGALMTSSSSDVASCRKEESDLHRFIEVDTPAKVIVWLLIIQKFKFIITFCLQELPPFLI